MALQIPLEQLRNTQKRKNKNTPIAFVTTYNRCNPNIFPLIKQNLETLKNNTRIKKLLESSRIIKSNRQPKNLKKILTSAYFGPQHTAGVKKCNKPKCQICHILIEGDSYYFLNHNIPFKIKRNLTCDSQNVIYVIKCINCLSDYIGCTKNLRERTNLHRSNINLFTNRNLPVSKHLFDCGKDFLIMPIYQCDNKNLIQMESKFIMRYKPKLNNTQNT